MVVLSRVLTGTALVLLWLAPAQAESLYHAMAIAYDSNPTLNAQRAATRANDENLTQAISGFRPQVFATADAAINDSSVSGTTYPYGYGINIQQSLFNGFRTINNVKAAKAGIEVSRQTLCNVEQNTLLTVVNAYVGVLRAQELLQIRRRNISFLDEQLRSSQARLDVGEGTRTDVAQSRAQLSLARAQLSAAQADLGSAQAQYRQAVGREPRQLRWPPVPTRLVPPSVSETTRIATRNHPVVRASEFAADAASFNVKVAEGAFLPTVTGQLSANKRYNAGGIQGNDISTSEARVDVRIPLYQGGSASSTVRQNKQVFSQRRIEIDVQRDSIRQEAVAAYTLMTSARANLKANSLQLSAANLALAGVVEERNVGQRTQLDVLLAQNSVLQAEELRVQSRASEIIAAYRVIAATGKLHSKRLGLKVAHYNPKKHLNAVKDKWLGLRTPSGQ